MTRKFVATVLSCTVVLGIVSCSSEISGVRDNEIEITASPTETTESVIEETTESTILTPTEVVAESSSVVETTEATETTTVETTEPSESTTVTTSETTVVQNEPSATTQTPPADPDPTSTPVPTSTPIPTATSTPVPTPTPEPVAVDIDASAREHGYEIIDIDMGNGTTQRIYGYYVDMSGLADKINDYRESIGLSRLPTDGNHIGELKTRAAEATVSFSHWRPNGEGGLEVNLSSGVNVDDCYNGLYNSDGHRAWWEADYVISIYCIGFQRMTYNESTNSWSGYGSATVVYMDF